MQQTATELGTSPKAAAIAAASVETSTWWDRYVNESVVPGPRGQPLSEWRNGRPTAWGDPLRYTEAAGGAWRWGERAAVGTTVIFTALAVSVGILEAVALGNQSIIVGYKGGEIFLKVGQNKFFRLNPFGDFRNQNPLARRPHYHRRPIKRPAKPGEGIGFHRPWEGGW